jgi:hypothetical protein
MDNQFGKLTTIISTVRHGEKNNFGELTDQGAKQSSKKGQALEHLHGDVILLHSGVNRVKETLTYMAKSLQENTFADFAETKEKQTTIGSFTDYTSHYLHYLYDPKNKGEYFVKWEEVNGDPVAELNRMKRFLELGSNSTEPEIYPSPREMAIRLGRVIATEIDFATITIPEVRTNYINGSHEPVIMAFLYYFLQDFPKESQPKNLNFLEEINGTLGFTEGFEIKVYQKLRGENTVIFKFRDITKVIEQEKLKTFCLGLD